jgi:hypothetical protein
MGGSLGADEDGVGREQGPTLASFGGLGHTSGLDNRTSINELRRGYSLLPSSYATLFDTTTSQSSSPGPSSSPPRAIKESPFSPPARPSSTPFTYLERAVSGATYADQILRDGYYTTDESELESSASEDEQMKDVGSSADLESLPTEIHEAILDHIFGYRVSATSVSSMKMAHVAGKWGVALRHARRRELSNLALVSRRWRGLVQQRLYRHIKLRASIDSLEGAMCHFAYRPHLRDYVKHVELWFPVFQRGYRAWSSTDSLSIPTVTLEGLTNTVYYLPGNNCTLEQSFDFIAQTFPRTMVLTLEGGERRKAPQVVLSRQPRKESTPSRLPSLKSVQVLVTKGQWNLMRDHADFSSILEAMPNLAEWQGSYSRPKSKSYITISEYIPSLPVNVTRLNLCLEGDYKREGFIPPFYAKVVGKTHICHRLAKVLPALEHFAYTGRVCHHLFDSAALRCDAGRSRLKSIDITVKNCCRGTDIFHDTGSGIQDMTFIEAFGKLVLSSVKSLKKFKELGYLNIRFVDLGMLSSSESNLTFGRSSVLT